MRFAPVVLALLLVGCQAGGAPLAPTSEPLPTAVPTAAPPTPVPPSPTAEPPTLTPIPPTSTPIPPTSTPVPPTPTIAPTLTATQVVQQGYCDDASPPAHLPLPVSGPTIRIPTPATTSHSLPSTGGPRREGRDPPPNVSAMHVAVLDEQSEALRFVKGAFGRSPPASITKIVTTMVALERQPDISHVYTTTVSATALVACDGSSAMGLEPNDHVKLETLLYGMMLPSGNDAA